MTREQAIEIVKTQYPHDHVMKTALGLLIPELRKSEDEMVRQSLIDLVNYHFSGEERDAALTYLEKQKEYHVPWYDYQKSREAGYTIVPNEEYEQLIKQEEQNPAWSEEDEKMFASISNLLWEGYAYGCFKEDKIPTPEWRKIRSWLKSLRPRPSWKPSEKQMNCLCAAVDAAIRKHNESVSGYEPARVLKSLYEDLEKLM